MRHDRTFLSGFLIFGLGLGVVLSGSVGQVTLAQVPFGQRSETSREGAIVQLARQTTVRILTGKASGSGVIVGRQGQTYTVLTNWHVIGFADRPTILTPDGQRYAVVPSRLSQLGQVDLAIVQFRSRTSYQVAAISQHITPGEAVYAAGFPMFRPDLTTTFDQGIWAFRLTQGTVSLLLSKSLYQGYRLGYTNEVAVGMSGGPVFNRQGQLVGVNGRVKNRDPAFGSYVFEDGSEPDPELLDQMTRSSWGIPMTTYLQFHPTYSSEVP